MGYDCPTPIAPFEMGHEVKIVVESVFAKMSAPACKPNLLLGE